MNYYIYTHEWMDTEKLTGTPQCCKIHTETRKSYFSRTPRINILIWDTPWGKKLIGGGS
jgi:hypothetical protein